VVVPVADQLEKDRKAWVEKQLKDGSTKSRAELRLEYDRINAARLPENVLVDRIKQLFPALSFLLEPDGGGFGADVRALLLERVRRGWTDEMFQSKFMDTPYYKTATSQMEMFDKMRPTDQEAKVEAYASQIREAYGNVIGDEAKFRETAREAARRNLTGNLLRNFVYLRAYETDSGAQLASQGQLAQELDELGRRYLLPSVPNDLRKQVLTGKMSLVDVENRLRMDSKVLYPHLAQYFDSGLSLSDVTRPYRRVVAQELELDEELVDFSEMKYARLLSPTDKGTAMSVSDVRRVLRTDPEYGWEFTDSAAKKATSVASSLARMFGRLR
jgi:hypothetical protein